MISKFVHKVSGSNSYRYVKWTISENKREEFRQCHQKEVDELN